MTFAKRKIDITFTLGKGDFGEDGSDTVKVTGLRCSALITSGTSIAPAELNLKVWGLPLSIMNRLTILRQDLGDRKSIYANFVTVEAGDDTSGMAIVFHGAISEAYADLSGMPDTCFVCVAYVGLLDQVKPVLPRSYNGYVDAALVMQDIASGMGRTLENNGVSVQIPFQYLPGTNKVQMDKVAALGNFHALLDPIKPVLAIWPQNGNRQGLVPLISKDTGLVGYPTYAQNGIGFTTLYNPSISPGGLIKLQTQLTPLVELNQITGTWYVYVAGHDLEAELPGGRWFTHVQCGTLGSQAALLNG